jgi:hypothetical protein
MGEIEKQRNEKIETRERNGRIEKRKNRETEE